MIAGKVNANREAVVRVDLRGPRRRRRVSAIVDTGYSGFLTLPRLLVDQLELRWERIGSARLADGGKTSFDVYAAKIHWDGTWKSIPVACCGDEVLLGMELLEGYELRVRGQIGGSVTITAIAHDSA